MRTPNFIFETPLYATMDSFYIEMIRKCCLFAIVVAEFPVEETIPLSHLAVHWMTDLYNGHLSSAGQLDFTTDSSSLCQIGVLGNDIT